MIRTVLPILFIAAGICSLATPAVFAQDISMEQAMALAQPGPEHKRLTALAGDWKIDLEMNMEMKPGGQMTAFPGTSKATSILGGRFIQFENNTEFMGMSGNSFQIMGYDSRFNKYFFFGIDELGTYYIIAEGEYDESNNQLVLDGIDKWPMPDGSVKENKYRMVYTLGNDDSYNFSIQFGDESGEMFEVVKGTAARQ